MEVAGTDGPDSTAGLPDATSGQVCVKSALGFCGSAGRSGGYIEDDDFVLLLLVTMEFAVDGGRVRRRRLQV